jgi:aconitate hydratase
MINVTNKGFFYIQNEVLIEEDQLTSPQFKQVLIDRGFKNILNEDISKSKEFAKKNTITYNILKKHSVNNNDSELAIRFNSLVSHDITYVGIIQNARASGLQNFPVLYALTNCHNSLCAVGGTVNEDDHLFGLSAAKKYGGVFVPANFAVIHQYAREMMVGCGKMILGSDSHTRYGALGTMGIGEGGPEIVKQLLSWTYNIEYPKVVGVYLKGNPKVGIGPHDVALALIGNVFRDGIVKNKIMEFIGHGIHNLSIDFRNGIDVMTTEMGCLSSIWSTDELVKEYYTLHDREGEYSDIKPGDIAYYDQLITIDLDKIEPMIALPFHPSNVYTIAHVKENCVDILHEIEKEGQKIFGKSDLKISISDNIEHGKLKIKQGVVAGCVGGTYENIYAVSSILNKTNRYSDMSLNIYPASIPIYNALQQNRLFNSIIDIGGVVKNAFCGPCFGAGDTPANNTLSIRHTTRNFPNREGSKPTEGQLSYVALMDARSIAATYVSGGFLTSAFEIEYSAEKAPVYKFNSEPYKNKVYNGFRNPKIDEPLIFGPNIIDWPELSEMPNHLLLFTASVLLDSVTTTDELIPSGETSSYRSNPYRLAQFTLNRKDPGYAHRSKNVDKLNKTFLTTGILPSDIKTVFDLLCKNKIFDDANYKSILSGLQIGSCIFAKKIGDGSAREQAASCQKILGGFANIAYEYATARYKSNLINWGIIPFIVEKNVCPLELEDYLFIPGIRNILKSGLDTANSWIIRKDKLFSLTLKCPNLSKEQLAILISGCLINYYKNKK